MDILFANALLTVLVGLMLAITFKKQAFSPHYFLRRWLQTTAVNSLLLLWGGTLALPNVTWPLLITLMGLVYLYGFAYILPEHPNLTFIPSLFKRELNVHLTDIETPFNRGVYRDLIALINTMPSYRVHRLILTSPLLAKNGEFRNTDMLEMYGVTVESKVSSHWRAPLQAFTLYRYKYWKKSPVFKDSDIKRRYQLLLTRL
ncbi:hypothetical protein [Vibrio mediterranei]|uniref:Uncharacterized protein n=1 Tax=Vibrio mediterranei TaxID=689 RepID=A0ABX5DD15_9VIBR|nr:hypothetical protein [Vibrio mediterranei]PCD85632.1 hypothetical protein COR52_25725 [Vibrio mediterranei]PRQ66511.1 hypothetical protein COR51_16380 [Vibrio mediterranei]